MKFFLLVLLFVLLPSPSPAVLGNMVLKACQTYDRNDTDWITHKSLNKDSAYKCIVWDCNKPDLTIYIDESSPSDKTYWVSSNREHCE